MQKKKKKKKKKKLLWKIMNYQKIYIKKNDLEYYEIFSLH